MKKQYLLVIGGILFIGMFFLGMSNLIKASNIRLAEREEAKWFVGETKHGIKLISIKNNFWGNDEPKFNCLGEIIDLTVYSTALFPNNKTIILQEANANEGYVIVEIIN